MPLPDKQASITCRASSDPSHYVLSWGGPPTLQLVPQNTSPAICCWMPLGSPTPASAPLRGPSHSPQLPPGPSPWRFPQCSISSASAGVRQQIALASSHEGRECPGEVRASRWPPTVPAPPEGLVTATSGPLASVIGRPSKLLRLASSCLRNVVLDQAGPQSHGESRPLLLLS